MPYFELVILIQQRGETPSMVPPPEYRGSRFRTERHEYVCSQEGTECHPKWRWTTV